MAWAARWHYNSAGEEGLLTSNAAKVQTVSHPQVEDSLLRLRDRETGTETFRRHARLATLVLASSDRRLVYASPTGLELSGTIEWVQANSEIVCPDCEEWV